MCVLGASWIVVGAFNLHIRSEFSISAGSSGTMFTRATELAIEKKRERERGRDEGERICRQMKRDFRVSKVLVYAQCSNNMMAARRISK